MAIDLIKKIQYKNHNIQKVLIDGDILVYKCGFSVEGREYHLIMEGEEESIFSSSYIKEVKDFLSFLGLSKEDEGTLYRIEKRITPEPLENALHNVDEIITNIQEMLGVKEYQLFLTGKENYRDKIATIQKYKGNRDGMAKPHWYKEIRRYLIDDLGAVVIEGQEADDAMSIEMCQSEDGSRCIATIDKDLDNTPGWHYNFDSGILYNVLEKHATYNFYKQLLTGDRTDNIRGIPGIGDKRADMILDGLYTEEEYAQEVYERYVDLVLREYDDSQEDVELDELNPEVIGYRAWQQMRENGQLLWMRREEGEMWEPPKTIKRLGYE